MKIGLVGFPGSGKTTVFNALTGLAAETGYGAARPGTTNLGSVKVPDSRLDRLAALYEPRKTTYAEIAFCDIAGGTDGRGLDRGVLNSMREMDALAQVARAFENPALADAPDPRQEIADMLAESVLADLEIVERRVDRLRKDRSNPSELALMETLQEHLEAERPLRLAGLDEQQRRSISGYQFLTLKPLLVVVNVAEAAIADPISEDVAAAAAELDAGVVALSGGIEMEIAHLPEEERAEFYEDLGVTEAAGARFVRAAFELLDLVTMLTVGPDECRAWSVAAGSPAPRAAGKIHSDIERGFIRVEIIRWDDLLELGSEARCREAGKLRIEGRDYVVQDGDVAHFRFNV